MKDWLSAIGSFILSYALRWIIGLGAVILFVVILNALGML